MTEEKDPKHEHEHERDILAKEQPIVLESAADDPIFPAMSEFEVDEDGPKGSTRSHPGALWIGIAVAAVALSCIIFMLVGDWNW